MIDAMAFLFALMILSWMLGLIFMIIGAFDDVGIFCALFVWICFSMPLTGLWAILWVILEVAG